MAVIRDSEEKKKKHQGEEKNTPLKNEASLQYCTAILFVCFCVYVCACLCLVGIYDFSVLALGCSPAPNNTAASGVKAVSVRPLII